MEGADDGGEALVFAFAIEGQEAVVGLLLEARNLGHFVSDKTSEVLWGIWETPSPQIFQA